MRECAGLNLKPRKGFSKEILFEVNPSFIQASLIAQLVKNPPAMRETPVQLLVWNASKIIFLQAFHLYCTYR